MGKKTGALLALLALTPGRPRPREEVLDLLWPDVDFDEARNRFKQVVFRLRKQLEPEGVAPGSVLSLGRTHLGLAPGHQSDVALFEQQLRQAASTADLQKRAQHLQAALALYQGELCPGFYLDILLTERERLAMLAQGARERLAALEALGTAGDEGVPARKLIRTENRFFGRQSEKQHLHHLLKKHRLVTLLGPGGTGKTRLVQELQANLPGAHFVSLSTLRNGASISDTLVTNLALPDSPEPALVRLKIAFAHTPTLLILDNLEQLVESGGAEAIAQLLETVPTLQLLVTSRLRLNLPQECVCSLAPLSEGHAIALFLDRVQLAKSTFEATEENAAIIAELCRRLDGLPLALELAAARVSVLTPAQILERLSRRFDLLSDKRRDREERHASLRAALDWGWSLLAPDVQSFFARLCVFRGSFSLEAAEAITQEPLALDYIQSLVDASFVVPEAEHFRLLETLREYGLEKLDNVARATLSHAHADYFLACTAHWRPLLNGGEFVRGIQLFKQGHENLLAAIERMVVLDPQKALTLCLNTAYYWNCTHWIRPGLAYMLQAREAAESVGISGVAIAGCHQVLGSLYSNIRETKSALEHCRKHLTFNQQQLEEYTAAGTCDEQLFPFRRSVAGALHNLGDLYFQQDLLEAAEQHFHEAEALNTKLGNDAWRALNLHGLFRVARRRAMMAREPEERRVFFEQALCCAQEGGTLCRRTQQDYDLCYFLEAQAYLLPFFGRFEEADVLQEECLALACTLEHWHVICWLLQGYARRAEKEQRYPEAVQLHGAIAQISQRYPEVQPDKDDSHLFPALDLPATLGQERYDAYYQHGFAASLENIKVLVAQK